MMNVDRPRSTPPLIPAAARRKNLPPGMPPIPAEALKGEITKIVDIGSLTERKKGPPPVPEIAKLKQRLESIQTPDIVEAFEVQGFEGFEVVGTLEKKDTNKEGAGPNEDAILFDPETRMIGALDGAGGMGGRPDLASKVASTEIPKGYKKALAEAPSAGELQNILVEQMMKRVVDTPEHRMAITKQVESILSLDPKIGKKAHALLEAVKRANNAVKETKGATMACVSVLHKTADGREFAIIVNTGDTGAFKRRVDGTMKSLIPEDSLLSYMQERGILSKERLTEMKANPDTKFKFGNKEFSYKEMMRTATGGLGLGEPTPALSVELLRPGEELYLTSDGINDKFDDPETDEISLEDMSIPLADGVRPDGSIAKVAMADKANRLRTEAKSRRTYKKDDDIVVVGIRSQ